MWGLNRTTGCCVVRGVYVCGSTGQRAGFLFPVRPCGSVEAKVHQAGVLVQACREVSSQTYLIKAQMPLFIFRAAQLISALVSEPLGKSDLLLPLGAAHVHSLT